MKLAELKKIPELRKIFTVVKYKPIDQLSKEVVQLNVTMEKYGYEYKFIEKSKVLKLTKINNASIVKGMSEYEINKFIELFFLKGSFPNEIEIARKLIVDEYCIVPKSSILWNGGIGDFIMESKTDSNFVGCKRISFNIAKFLKSKLFKEIKNISLDNLEDKLEDINKKHLALQKEFNVLNKL